MNPPYWALSFMYWLHMAATVIWVGGLTALALVVVPAARRSLEPLALNALLAAIQRRFDPLAWLSLAVLVGTGMFQMSANPNYAGFLAFDNRWALALLAKHIVFIGLVGVSAYLTWGLLPRLRQAALLRAAGRPAPDAAAFLRQEQRLIALNAVLGVIILALTALARAA